jgi:hypothetical protein
MRIANVRGLLGGSTGHAAAGGITTLVAATRQKQRSKVLDTGALTTAEQPGAGEPLPEGSLPCAGWQRGARLLDARTGRVGEVMDVLHNLVYLRPPGGGCEWEARREDLRGPA